MVRNAADLGMTPCRRRFDPALLDPRAGGRPAAGAGGVPAGRGQRPPSCASRTGSPATSRTLAGGLPPLVRHAAGCCRRATRPIEPTCTGRGCVLVDADPHGARQRPGPARRLRARADVSRAHVPRGRLGARRRRPPRPVLAARARRPQRAGRRTCGRGPRSKADGVLAVGGVAADRPGRRARHAGVRPRRGRLPGPGPRLPRRVRRRTTSTTPARRSCARRSRAGSPRRGCGLDVCSGGELAVARAGGLPAGADRLPRQQQVARRAARAPSSSAWAGSSSTRSTRSSGWPRSPRELRRHRAGDGPGDRRRRGAHPRVHRHRPRGPEVRLLDRQRRRARRPSRGCSRAAGSSCSACTPTSAARSSTPPASRSRPAGCSRCTPRSSDELGVDAARARPRRRLRHRLHHPGRPVRPGAAGHRADQDRRARVPRARRSPMPRLSIEPGRAIVGPGDVHGLRGRHGQAGRARRRRGRAPTSRVDGGMSDNIRTALYDADYSCDAGLAAPPTRRRCCRRVVGKHCEAGDIVVKDEFLPGDVAPGDLLAVPGTGAYCRSMASQLQPRPAPAGGRGAGRAGSRHRAATRD